MAMVGAKAGEDLRWFALRTAPDQRLMMCAAKYLRHLGLVAEYATEQRLRRKHRKEKERKLITYTSAPGYVFIALQPGAPIPWRDLMSIHLIKSFVTINGQPAVLDSEAVMRFLKFEEGNLPEYYRFFRTGSEFAVGDSVIITKGPLADFELRVQDVQDGEAIFFMRLLGADVEVRVGVNDCMKAA